MTIILIWFLITAIVDKQIHAHFQNQKPSFGYILKTDWQKQLILEKEIVVRFGKYLHLEIINL
jgi:hypothetical protein